MIFKLGKQFNCFAAITFKHGIIDDEDAITICRSQGIHLLYGSRPEQRQKASPGKAGVIEKTVNRILARKQLGLATLQ
ncbi:hypothetical protein D3C74_423930 [compost metagenome]